MTDSKPPVLNFEPIDEELVARISGGGCTPQDLIDVLGQLKDGYDNLVDFTSYVIDRVVTGATNSN